MEEKVFLQKKSKSTKRQRPSTSSLPSIPTLIDFYSEFSQELICMGSSRAAFPFSIFMCACMCVCSVHNACFASMWVCIYMCAWQHAEALVLMLELIFSKPSILFFQGRSLSQIQNSVKWLALLASLPWECCLHIQRLELLVGYHGIYVSSGELNSISHTLTTIVMEF